MSVRPCPAWALMLSLGTSACHVGAPTTALPVPAEPAETPAAEAEIYSNTVKWTTASEIDNFGYDVYRSDSPDGPFVRLTEEPVEGAGTSDDANSYRFVDTTIDPTNAYYYYVESISMSGLRELFTPVGKAKAKLPIEPTSARIPVPEKGAHESDRSIREFLQSRHPHSLLLPAGRGLEGAGGERSGRQGCAGAHRAPAHPC